MSVSSFFLLLLTNILGGASFVATSYALKNLSPFAVVFWRVVLAGPFFLPFCIRFFKKNNLGFGEGVRISLIAVIGYDMPLWAGAWGQKLSSATHAALLMALEPMAIIFLSAIFLDEKLSVLKIFALVLSLTGSFLIVAQGHSLAFLFQSPHGSYLGDGFLCVQGILFALYTILGKPLLKKMDALSLTALTSMVAVFPLLFCAGIFHLPVVKFNFLKTGLVPLLYLSLGVSFLGVLTWNLAMERVSASILANFIFVQPLLGALLGVFLLGEGLNWGSSLGGAFILAGVYFAALEKSPIKNL